MIPNKIKLDRIIRNFLKLSSIFNDDHCQLALRFRIDTAGFISLKQISDFGLPAATIVKSFSALIVSRRGISIFSMQSLPPRSTKSFIQRYDCKRTSIAAPFSERRPAKMINGIVVASRK
ncbi:hypothetical protein LEP1GSC111_1510 [Leptospira interrogans str. UT126]|nr:hypothetical protein LEP1GSC111_0564 [Leptospira interrogans str. UT126]EMJ47802.1 hypothetical protein LEP1GSC111_1205 [Leptospira interrogans str. UT126]EMJ48570.1 hypothetical protein LEP1GSC111_2261 [Leptospira interrogans str. UT126]EMJ49469.1 hypothetical protein LEP1GSC111_0617 [Leptospira interrogans str. UT126]EMJ55123.1 hypothetical protein LEP1GSC111_0296 [Leptospira interrogans str. UT126]